MSAEHAKIFNENRNGENTVHFILLLDQTKRSSAMVVWWWNVKISGKRKSRAWWYVDDELSVWASIQQGKSGINSFFSSRGRLKGKSSHPAQYTNKNQVSNTEGVWKMRKQPSLLSLSPMPGYSCNDFSGDSSRSRPSSHTMLNVRWAYLLICTYIHIHICIKFTTIMFWCFTHFISINCPIIFYMYISLAWHFLSLSSLHGHFNLTLVVLVASPHHVLWPTTELIW